MSGGPSRYVAVIPAYNEAATICDIVARTLAHVPEIIVIDDGSQDGTAEALRESPVTVRRHERNLGKGAALWHGMEQAIDRGATGIITLDGDGQHEPEVIPRLIATHLRNPRAIVIGSRLHERYAMPIARYVANRVANFWIAWACGQPIADSQSGLRVYPASLLRPLAQSCDRTKGFVFESEILINAARLGVPIAFVPVPAVYGRHLRRSHFRQGRDIARITRMVARKLLARRLDLPALIKSRRRRRNGETSVGPCPERSMSRGEAARRRLLFVAEAVSLAHIARAWSMARLLDPARYEIHLACDPRYAGLFQNGSFVIHPLQSIGNDQFQDRLRRGEPLYTVSELRQYVKDDLKVIDAVSPAAVIGDFRLSLAVSARTALVPYMTITNAHWSPYARPRFIVPELAITERFGVRWGQRLFNMIRPAVFAYHAWSLNQVRREYGLPAIGYSLSRIFTEADMTVYADVPALVPTAHLPRHHRYVDPIVWSPEIFPPWWHRLPDGLPLAYVSLGSSGRGEVLPNILKTLDRLGIGAVVSTAGRYLPIELSDRVWTADYIPGLQAAARAAFVICNGGSAPVYQAFMAGKPVLGIPCNLDQYLMMDYVSTFGAGVAVRTGQASAEALAEAVEHLLQDSRYKDRAALLQATIQSRQGLASFAGLVDELVEGRGERKHDTRPVRAEGELVGSETRLASEQR